MPGMLPCSALWPILVVFLLIYSPAFTNSIFYGNAADSYLHSKLHCPEGERVAERPGGLDS